MAVFKCKMCGADLTLVEGSNICECEYCGTQQTVPTADNDKKMNLFNRANRLRFANEFDKASGVFESIVSEFPEEAEAYWGLCLCKYGIEYVDDPATAKKIPTCHRTSYDSIFNDSNFEMAQEYADVVARKLYREEAKEIDRLQKSILAIAQNEEPFDIFICYKETAENGQRTIDSVLAQDMYDALTEKGYKVFFARITLEDKLGQEYEPYIFSALNSARVMLAVGTSYEYYNAVWVKNEWGRFLDMMKSDKKKVLIPCYKDIDAYDIPGEFKPLQAQDMGKVGFMQDLIRGIGKIIPLQKQSVQNTVVVQQSPQNATVESLLKRAFMFLEEGEWDKANEYCERVLDITPESGKAYFYKFLIEYRIKSEQELDNSLWELYRENKNIKNAVKYAESDFSAWLNSVIAQFESNINNPDIQYEYYQRYKDSKDFKIAISWCQRAANKGQINAQFDLGNIYESGDFGAEKNYQEAMQWYRKAADQGDMQAQLKVADFYYNGIGSSQNYGEAFKWYAKAADQGNLESQCKLADMYKSGFGVEKNYEEAANFYRKAAEQDYAEAQFKMGFVYEKGFGVKQDYEEAIKWYNKAAAQGYGNAYNNLGFMYDYGIGVPKNYEIARKYYLLAAEKNCLSAQNNLGIRCLDVKNYTEAYEWFKKAIEHENSDIRYPQYQLARLYYYGNGVTKNYEEAFKWAKKSAELGYSEAQYLLGVMYDNGDGISSNDKEAFKWYSKAAEQGDAMALKNLGRLYYYGWGVEKNHDKAIELLKSSLRKGCNKAGAELKRLGYCGYCGGVLTGGLFRKVCSSCGRPKD